MGYDCSDEVPKIYKFCAKFRNHEEMNQFKTTFE